MRRACAATAKATSPRPKAIWPSMPGNNYIFSPKKFVALVGVENLVIVDTEDALLIAHRDHSQDVGKIVKELDISGRSDLI